MAASQWSTQSLVISSGGRQRRSKAWGTILEDNLVYADTTAADRPQIITCTAIMKLLICVFKARAQHPQKYK